MQKTTNALMQDWMTQPHPAKKSKSRRVVPTDINAGIAKYLWSDGCMYSGEWRRGRPCGQGKFSWPSGATYEGHFYSGRMHGLGTFLGPHGESYEGSWVSDRKHGHGVKRYSNGDVYEGHWFRDLQNGKGRYVWAHPPAEYDGDWSLGSISGYGVLLWGDGNARFQGYWEKGVPRSSSSSTTFEAAQLGSSESMPRICIWDLDDGNHITCDILQPQNSIEHQQQQPPNSIQQQQNHQNHQTSMPGLTTLSKGHKNYDLMLNVQLGIRHTLSKGNHSSIHTTLTSSHFDPNNKFWTRFPPHGSKHTPPHHSLDFKWKDYCPTVFTHLRHLFAIDSAHYMLAICGNDALRQFSSPGKSGSFFYLTQDDRFIIKTIKKSELKVLIRMLPTYYQHVSQYKNSLVTKFFGVHCVKPVGGQKTRFVVMGNLFCSDYRIHRRYDLKGSSHGRTIDKPEGEIDETTTLKDLDLNYVFHLETSWFQELIWQIERDCEFLEAERIMDYSLLIGLHFRGDNSVDQLTFDTRSESKHKEVSTRGSTYHPVAKEELKDVDWVLQGRGPVIRLGANMPGRAERVSNGGGESSSCSSTPSTPNRPNGINGINGNVSNISSNGGGGGESETFDVILYFGIIDILQDYDITKKIEHAYKSLQVDPTSISAVDPKLYSKRFRHFIHTIFLQDTTLADS